MFCFCRCVIVTSRRPGGAGPGDHFEAMLGPAVDEPAGGFDVPARLPHREVYPPPHLAFRPVSGGSAPLGASGGLGPRRAHPPSAARAGQPSTRLAPLWNALDCETTSRGQG